jgi:hypothetical protein
MMVEIVEEMMVEMIAVKMVVFSRRSLVSHIVHVAKRSCSLPLNCQFANPLWTSVPL